MTHSGGAPRWEIVRDSSAPHSALVLAQLSRDPTAGRFPLAIWDRAVARDGEVSVAFKAVDGSIDRAAGIVWRYKDQNNYYIVRANALENKIMLSCTRSKQVCGLRSRPKGSRRARTA